jgi:hypothetical protein
VRSTARGDGVPRPVVRGHVGCRQRRAGICRLRQPDHHAVRRRFLLARATFKHRLNERVAYRVLSLSILGNSPTRAFVFLGLTSAGISA